jgi:DNA-binding CsgD family transcriptional regulator
MFDDYNTNEIAQELSISTRTVDTHRKNMLKKTGIQSTIGLIKYALVRGLIRLE